MFAGLKAMHSISQSHGFGENVSRCTSTSTMNSFPKIEFSLFEKLQEDKKQSWVHLYRRTNLFSPNYTILLLEIINCFLLIIINLGSSYIHY